MPITVNEKSTNSNTASRLFTENEHSKYEKNKVINNISSVSNIQAKIKEHDYTKLYKDREFLLKEHLNSTSAIDKKTYQHFYTHPTHETRPLQKNWN